jgi:hypothetical protein
VQREYKIIVAIFFFFSLIIPTYLIFQIIFVWVLRQFLKLPDGNGVVVINLNNSHIIGKVYGYLEPDGMGYSIF